MRLWKLFTRRQIYYEPDYSNNTKHKNPCHSWSFLAPKISIAEDQVVIMANNQIDKKCHACDLNIVNGIEWKNDNADKSLLTIFDGTIPSQSTNK